MGPLTQFELVQSPVPVPAIHGREQPFPHLQLRVKEFRPELMIQVLSISFQTCLKCFIIGQQYPKIDFEAIQLFRSESVFLFVICKTMSIILML